MSYQVFARKWRPRYFRDVKGQEHITRTLVNSIKNDKIAHAYLLTGTRGIGKTTIARIFAKAIRCEDLSPEGEPCLKCNSCLTIDSGNSLDYIEVDGASNNSVDDIRDLIENVQYLPANGKYKVYVIDEVHMLSVNAFNALLKTLEEPPEHVVFIFATTDPQKLIGTVLSRCQRFDFKNSSIEDSKSLIKYIAENEGISFENDLIIDELAKQGKGSFRDSLSLFDQVLSLSNSNTISEEAMKLSLGIASRDSVNKIIEAILEKDREKVKSLFMEIMSENVDLKVFLLQVLDRVYAVVSNVDRNGNFTNSLGINNEVLSKVTLIEVMWIYESLAKDLEWALNSIAPENSSIFCFLKVTLREELAGIAQSNPIQSVEIQKKKIIEPVTSSDPVETKENLVTTPETQIKEEPIVELKPDSEQPVEESKPQPPEQVEEKSWEGFIKFLYQEAKSLAVNIERGNLLNKEDFEEPGAFLRVAFTKDCKIFFDFLNDIDRKHELIEMLSEYLGLNKEDLSINFEILDENLEENQSFQSSVEIEENNIAQVKEEKRQEILNNKFIKSAEDLFNSKIDKVVLNEE